MIPGKITPITFTINNVGSAPLRDLTFQWENEDDIILPVSSDNTKYIKNIEIGESADLKFDVIASASADPDLYKLDLSLSYDDPLSGEDKSINTKAGIYVGGATDFDVAFSESSNGEYSFSIANIGSVAASSVTIKVPEQEGWKVSGSNSEIIGNLNQGDYTIASFNLQKSNKNSFLRNKDSSQENKDMTNQKTSEKTNQDKIKIDVLYTDSRGNRNTITKEIPISSSSSLAGMSKEEISTSMAKKRGYTKSSPLEQIWNNGKWIFIGLIATILIFTLRKRYKKGKLKNPNYSYRKALKSFFKK